MENFATRLLAAIEYRGVSQKWLADNANTTEATISRYVNNKASPSIIVVLRDVASALKVSSDYLIGLTNLPQSKDDIDIEEKTTKKCFSPFSTSILHRKKKTHCARENKL